MTQPACSREYYDSPCEGEVFVRTSRSGLTEAWICEGHAAELEASLDAIEQRYPEVNHPDGCGCYGCSDGSW
jgi:hypothetical protein